MTIKMIEKCKNCFWNYNCPYADGDELTEEDFIEIEKCQKNKK